MEMTDILCTICLDYLVPGFTSREGEKFFTGTLKMVQLNPVPVFFAKKNTSTIWRKIFTEISVQMVNTPGDVSGGGPRDLPVTRSESAYQSSKPLIGLAQL